MGNEPFDRFPDLPDRKMWPAFLVDAVDGGKYFILAHGGDQVVLLSLIPGDIMQSLVHGSVQARLAIDLKTGAVVSPLPGVDLNRWQADMCGMVDLYDQRKKELNDRPFDLSEWNFIGSRRGIPKKNR